MCGILGVIALGGQPVSSAPLSAMAAALAHRGPDGDGFWTAPGGRTAFGHRRLAIIDIDPRADQPMKNEDGSVVVVFNGEIYNHAGLRRELLEAGHRFATRSSDTETLVHGYEEWGIDGLLSRIEGIYSFAVADLKRATTHLVRDGIGIKPLYVAQAGAGEAARLVFASELRAVLAHEGVPRAPAWGRLGSYLTFMAVPAPLTMAEGVFKVPAGHRLEVGPAGPPRLVRFFDPVTAAERAPADAPTTIRELRHRLERAVSDQMIADVPVGVMLSGGIDSGAILALASRGRSALDAYTVRFQGDDGLDESRDAAEMARLYGARHHICELSPDEALDSLDAVISAMDEPQADWVCVPLWFLSRAVSREGGKVVLVGEGADEQFAGYEHWRLYLGRIQAAARRIRPVGRLVAAAAGAAGRIAPHDLRLLTRVDFARRAARGDEMFWGGAILAWPTVRDALLGPSRPGDGPSPPWVLDGPASAGADGAGLVRSWYAAIDASRGGQEPLDRMIAAEFMHRLPELLLMRVDKMTMAHGVEARVPFLDRRLVSFSFGVPADLKLQGPQSKWLLREAVADLLPDAIRLMPKRGFGAPVDRWLRGRFGEVALETIRGGPLADVLDLRLVERLMREHRAASHNHAGLLWALHVMSRWMTLTFGPRA